MKSISRYSICKNVADCEKVKSNYIGYIKELNKKYDFGKDIENYYIERLNDCTNIEDLTFILVMLISNVNIKFIHLPYELKNSKFFINQLMPYYTLSKAVTELKNEDMNTLEDIVKKLDKKILKELYPVLSEENRFIVKVLRKENKEKQNFEF